MANRFNDAQPERLALLLSLDESFDDKSDLWGEICAEQLLVSVISENEDSGTSDRLRLQTLACSVTPAINNFRDLLEHANPPLELLIVAKEVAKRSDQSLVASVPPEIAGLLYYAFIAKAIVVYGQMVSSLRVEHLLQGFDWCATQNWADKQILELIGRGAALVRGEIRE